MYPEWHKTIIEKVKEIFPKMIINEYPDEILINGHRNTNPIKITDYFWRGQQKYMLVNIQGEKRKYKTLDEFINHLEDDIKYFFIEIGEYNSLIELKGV